ncbi:hypothetical protein EV363DRAFT_437654 [Boletus edulis]|nr:hypothetical protein EV363DRAFT_437654 [Boletus edulis]
MDVLRPFFEYTLRPEGPIYVAPLQPNMESVSRSSTLRLPPIPSLPGSGDNDNSSGPSARTFAACLPPTRDFLFAPLMHLLRSGISPVFRAIPGNWTASEVDVVRATLLLAYAARRVLLVHSLEDFVHSPAEVVFACYVEVWSGIHIEASREVNSNMDNSTRMVYRSLGCFPSAHFLAVRSPRITLFHPIGNRVNLHCRS